MKTSSNELFRLVKSLTKSEKGYFKKFASRDKSKGEKKYVQLFDAIDELEQYNETVLKKKLNDNSLIKDLPVYKVYLFNMILKSLYNYGLINNAETKINELLINVRMLNSKGLYKESMKYMAKAKELAYKYHMEKHILDILTFERNIQIILPDKNIYEKRKKIYEEQLELSRRLNSYFEYSWLSDQIVILVEQKGDAKKTDTVKLLDNIISSPLFTDKRNACTYNTSIYFHNAHAMYNLMKNELVVVLEHLKKSAQIMEENRHMIIEMPVNYIQYLINIMMIANIAGSKSEADIALGNLSKTIRNLKNKIPVTQLTYISFHALNAELTVHFSNFDFERAGFSIKELEIDFDEKKYELPSSLRAVLYAHLIKYYFYTGNMNKALKYINEMLNDSSANFRADVYNLNKLLYLMAHYELKNFELLEYEIDSTAKFLKKKDAMSGIENKIIKFLRNSLDLMPDETDKAFEELVYNLKKEYKGVNRNIPNQFDFLAWAESKVYKKPIPDILKSISAGENIKN